MTIVCLVAMISVNAQDDMYETVKTLNELSNKALSKNKNNCSSYNGLWYCSEYDTTIEIEYPNQIVINKGGETLYIICKRFIPQNDELYNYEMRFGLPVFGDYRVSLLVNVTRFKEDLIVLDVKSPFCEGGQINKSYKLIKQ